MNYRDELEDSDRILLWLRKFLRGEINIEEFIMFKERIQAKELLKSERSLYAAELMEMVYGEKLENV